MPGPEVVAVVESGSLRARVVELGRRCAADQRRLCRLVVTLEQSGEWTADGAPTCAHWIADALEIEVSTAREWLRVGRALQGLPVVDEAFETGRLSYSKVRTLTRVATPENAEEICAVAERTPAGRLGGTLAAWLLTRERPEETANRQHRARGLSWRLEPDGMVVGHFRLPPDQAAVLTTAVDTMVWRGLAPAASADASGLISRWPSIAQQRADALIEIVRSGGGELDTEIVIHLRGDGSTFDDGTPIAGSLVERLAPGAYLRVLLHDAQSRPINASTRRRRPSRRQQRVVRERDRVCVDCGATDFLEFDHDPAYERSGRTVVEELRLRCWMCHRARHRREARSADTPPEPDG